jgi:hypothetical protein
MLPGREDLRHSTGDPDVEALVDASPGPDTMEFNQQCKRYWMQRGHIEDSPQVRKAKLLLDIATDQQRANVASGSTLTRAEAQAMLDEARGALTSQAARHQNPYDAVGESVGNWIGSLYKQAVGLFTPAPSLAAFSLEIAADIDGARFSVSRTPAMATLEAAGAAAKDVVVGYADPNHLECLWRVACSFANRPISRRC